MDLQNLSLKELLSIKKEISEIIKNKYTVNVKLALNCNSNAYEIFNDVIGPVYEKLFGFVPSQLSLHDPLLVMMVETILDSCKLELPDAMPKITTISFSPGYTYKHYGFIVKK